MEQVKFTYCQLVFVCCFCCFTMNYSSGQNKTEFSFKYRDTYFPMVTNTEEFKAEYKNTPLDETWGLWGHNLPKWIPFYIPQDSPVYALIDNDRNKEQFCFSSEELKEIIIKNIKDRKKSYDYYMINPNDNGLVCQCDKCKAAGNTQTDASPALFNLLGELAEKFPNQEFFTTAYISVKTPPKKQQPKNVGVFFSTIEYQKGKPYRDFPEADELKNQLKNWKEKVNEIFAWEYALNYDDYFDFYPNLKVLQENLKFLKENGITGIFINGSETYSALQGVKAGSIARLLMKVDSDLNEIISDEVEKRFPSDTNQFICNYYLAIQDDFAESKKPMGIYSGIGEAIKKYIDFKRFNEFYKQLEKASSLEENNFNLQALLLSATFLKLEQMRYLGIQPNGYAIFKDFEIQVLPETKHLLENLALLAKNTGIDYYDEPNDKISDYIHLWKKEIIENDKTNYFIHQKLKSISQLDEAYSNIKILNNGTYGFLDYNTNWLICTVENLKIQVPHQEIYKKANQIKVGLLNDPKHQIYFPTEIILQNNGQENKVTIKPSLKKEKKTIEIPIDFNKIDGDFTLTFIRPKNKKSKNAIACDEIIIN